MNTSDTSGLEIYQGRTRATRAYREKIGKDLSDAYAEEALSHDEYIARLDAAESMRTVEQLHGLTADLPQRAPRSGLRQRPLFRVAVYLAAIATFFTGAIAGPVVMTAGRHGPALDVAGVGVCLTGVALVILTVIAAVNDKVLAREWG